MYNAHWIHSLPYSKFIELTLIKEAFLLYSVFRNLDNFEPHGNSDDVHAELYISMIYIILAWGVVYLSCVVG